MVNGIWRHPGQLARHSSSLAVGQGRTSDGKLEWVKQLVIFFHLHHRWGAMEWARTPWMSGNPADVTSARLGSWRANRAKSDGAIR